uniref:MHC class II antigen beta chain n=1 Tax=Panagrolaimus sp. PS1159 TaxID=55785 RepID=A0AC35FJC9_9BILA
NLGFRILGYNFCVERFLKYGSGVNEYGESNEIAFKDSEIFADSESRIQNQKIQKYELNGG